MKILLPFLLLMLALPINPYPAQAGYNDDQPVTCLYYFPLVGIQSNANRAVIAIEVTQAVQDEENGIALVAGRATVARVYVEPPYAEQAIKLYGWRGRERLAHSPLQGVQPVVNRVANRNEYHSSYNFVLPSEWTSEGALTLTAVLDDEENRQEKAGAFSTSVLFVKVPAMNIVIVPVRYINSTTGQVYPTPTTDTISQEVERLFPVAQVNVSFHSPVTFTGDLVNDAYAWPALLYQVTALKYWDMAEQDVAASTFYYGLVTDNNGIENLWRGVGGMGWVGERVAVGLDITNPYILQTTGQIAAHEFGHNMGRMHAPCGNPMRVDPGYPYAGGSIGQYGFDVLRETVWNPDPYEHSENPFGAYDIMSYCYPLWVSDYTYEGLLRDQQRWGALDVQAASVQENSREALLIQAVAGESGWQIAPVQYVNSAVTASHTSQGDFLIQLLDAAGEVVVSYQVQGMRAETPHGMGQAPDSDARPAQAVYALVPLPAAPVAAVRLVERESGQVLAERGMILER